MKLLRGAGLLFLASSALLGGARRAEAEPVMCKRTIVRETARYAQSVMKALQRCEDRKVRGNLVPGTDCNVDPFTGANVGRAESRLRAKVARRCGGADRVCGTADDDALASIDWAIGTCPNFESGSCTNTIQDCDDIGTCLACVGGAAVRQGIDLYYGALDGGQFGSGSSVNRCQGAIGKETAKFFAATAKALAKCWEARIRGRHANACPSPGDGRAVASIARAELRKRTRICSACGGPDRTCGSGGDLPPSEIGFTPSCPDVTVPGGAACAGAVSALANLVDCVDCVSEFKATCSVALAVPGLTAFPGACNGAISSTTTSTTVTGATTTTAPGATTTTSPGATTTTVAGGTTTTSATSSTTSTTLTSCDCCAYTRLRFTTGLPQVGVPPACGNVTPSACSGGSNIGTACTSDAECPGARCTGALDCGGLYFGGAGVSVPLPTVIPDTAISITKVQSCNPGTGAFSLSATTNVDTGSNRTCTAAGGTNPEYPRTGCLFGPPLPVPNANVSATSTCVVNRIVTSATGNADCGGAANINFDLSADLFLTGDLLSGEPGIQPCPICPAGSCLGGPNAGLTCTAGSSDLGDASPTTHDCPPPEASFIGSLPIPFALTTGTSSDTAVDADGPGNQPRAFCGFCRSTTAPNPFQNPPRSCTSNADCTTAPFTRCQQRTEGAFGNGIATTITETGTPAGCLADGAAHPAKLVSVFCVPPSYNGLVDAAADIPGPGAVALTGQSRLTDFVATTSTTTLPGATTTTNATTTSTTSTTGTTGPTTSTVPTTTSSTTSTTLAACPPPPLVSLGTFKTTLGAGTASCGGPGLIPGPQAPFSGEIDFGGPKQADLGLGCLYVGNGQGSLPGARLPDGGVTNLVVAGVNGPAITVTAGAGTGPADCSLGAGPGKVCLNGHPGTNGQGACTTDADCGGTVRSCDLQANCYFGPPVPVPLGGASTCIMNAIATNVCAEANLTTLDTTITSALLSARVYLTGDGASPCPRCVASTCTAGQRAGLSCTGGVGSQGTTIECPPDLSRFSGTLAVNLSGLSTGSSTLTADPNGNFCAGQTVPGVFGGPGDTIIENGSPLFGSANLFSLTLAGTFCTPSSGNVLFDNVAGLPGPGAVAVPASAEICLLPAVCSTTCNPCTLGPILCPLLCGLCDTLCLP